MLKTRKFLSLMIVVAMLISSLPVITAGAANINQVIDEISSADRTIINESFDNGDAISSLGITKTDSDAGDATLLEVASAPVTSSNALHYSLDGFNDTSTYVYVPLGEAVKTGTLTINYDLYAVTDNILVGAVCNSAWPPAVPVKITPEISPYNGNGNVSTKVYPDKTKWHDIKFVIDAEALTYDFYVDGTQYANDYAWRSASYNLNNTGITHVMFWIPDGTVVYREAYVDNLLVTHTEDSQWTKVSDDNFSNGLSEWEMLTENTTDVSIAGKSGDSDTDKVVKIDANNLTASEGLRKTFNDTTGHVVLSADYKIADASSRPMIIYFDGKNKSGNHTYAVSMVIDYSKIAYYTTKDGINSTGYVKTGMSNSGWQNIKLVLNVSNNSVGVWLNDKFEGNIPFRYMPDVASVHAITIGGENRSWGGISKPLYMDNIKLYTTASTDPVEITEDVLNFTFDKDTIGQVPAGFTGNSSTVVAGKTSTSDTNHALKLTSSQSANNRASFTLPSSIESSKVDVSYKFYKPNSSKAAAFSLQDSSGNFALSILTYGNRLYSISTNAAGGPQDDYITMGLATETWHDVVFHIDMDTKTFTVTLDSIDINGTYNLRNRDKITDISQGYVEVAAHGTDAQTYVMFDDIVISRDVTNYGMLELIVPSGMEVDRANGLVYGLPVGYPIESFINRLSSTPLGSTIYITDADGNVKDEFEALSAGDKVVVSHSSSSSTREYIVMPEYEVKLRGLTVGGNEYFEASKVTLPGKAKARAYVYNHTSNPRTVSLYAAVVGNKLYDVQVEKGITIDAASEKYVELELDVPDNCSDADIKLMVFDGTDSITPLCEYEARLVSTSQDISMPNIFSDHMVLQRNANVNIFGMAPTGSEVTAQYGEEEAVVGYAANGEFCVQLSMGDASTVGKTLTVTVQNADEAPVTFTYTDVVVGDVFYGSGQSNMDYPVSFFAGLESNLSFEENIRMYDTAHLYSAAPRVDGGSSAMDAEQWKVVTSSNMKDASATLYSTVWGLRQLGAIDENVPVGIVECAWGATSISRWVNTDIIMNSPDAEWKRDYLIQIGDNNGLRPTDNYYSMARSIVPYTFKSAIWYQGCQDAGLDTYDDYAKDMINMMRNDFGYDIPYYIVQLPGYGTMHWDGFRLVQWNIQNLVDDAHIVVTIDTGDAADIHPTDKHIVGKRIARQMMKHLYGMNNVAYSGPVYKSSSANGSSVTISFDFVNDGTHGSLCSLADDGSLSGFEVSADGSTWYAANASINGDTIVVSSGSVAAPRYVRYGWVNLTLKSAGNQTTDSTGTVKLPMAPFSEQIG